TAPVHPLSATYLQSIGGLGGGRLHVDTGGGAGISHVVVSHNPPPVPIPINAFPQQSHPRPLPIPLHSPIEEDSDAHLIAIQSVSCILYEMWQTTQMGAGFSCANSAVWDLKINATRPVGFTSADAAGLPIFPGLLRYDEIAAGAINHALRFTS